MLSWEPAKVYLPSALVIGPMKAGTSWIQDYLLSRGDVALPNGVKETFFFDRRYSKGIDWYAAHFHQATTARKKLAVEVAASYFHSPDVPQRIFSILGDVRLIVTLRAPVSRAWSHYLHLRRYGYTSAPLREATEKFPEILEASRYKTCLARWAEFFPRERVCILWLEDLAESTEQYVKDLCAGLSLPFILPPEYLTGKRNQAAMPRFVLLAAIGDRTAHFLRERRMYGVVNFAKRIGLKEIFFGRSGTGNLPRLEDSDAEWLTEQLGGEMPEFPAYSRNEMAENCND